MKRHVTIARSVPGFSSSARGAGSGRRPARRHAWAARSSRPVGTSGVASRTAASAFSQTPGSSSADFRVVSWFNFDANPTDAFLAQRTGCHGAIRTQLRCLRRSPAAGTDTSFPNGYGHSHEAFVAVAARGTVFAVLRGLSRLPTRPTAAIVNAGVAHTWPAFIPAVGLSSTSRHRLQPSSLDGPAGLQRRERWPAGHVAGHASHRRSDRSSTIRGA